MACSPSLYVRRGQPFLRRSVIPSQGDTSVGYADTHAHRTRRPNTTRLPCSSGGPACDLPSPSLGLSPSHDRRTCPRRNQPIHSDRPGSPERGHSSMPSNIRANDRAIDLCNLGRRVEPRGTARRRCPSAGRGPVGAPPGGGTSNQMRLSQPRARAQRGPSTVDGLSTNLSTRCCRLESGPASSRRPSVM